MKAVVLEAFGGVENLKLTEVPEPKPGPGQVLVRVRAVGLNFAEVLWRQQRYPRAKAPYILGWEIAGEVADVGEGVSWPRTGQRVFGFTAGGGGNAEYAVCDASSLMAVPQSVSFVDAASIPVVWGTVYHGLVTFGRVKGGEDVLIHAAGGGVGTIAVQWARALGARVIGTAGSDEKLERVKALGCDIAINYRTSDFYEAIKAEIGGVDMVLESVGGRVLEDSLKLLRPMGRLITFGYASGERPQIDPFTLFAKNLTISGLWFGRMEPQQQAEALSAAMRMLQSGKVRPVVGHRFPLEATAEAHALMESRGSYGKIVIEP